MSFVARQRSAAIGERESKANLEDVNEMFRSRRMSCRVATLPWDTDSKVAEAALNEVLVEKEVWKLHIRRLSRLCPHRPLLFQRPLDTLVARFIRDLGILPKEELPPDIGEQQEETEPEYICNCTVGQLQGRENGWGVWLG